VDPAGSDLPFLLRAADRGALAQHFLLLSQEQRYTRFFAPMTDERIRHYVDGIDFDTVRAVALADAQARLRGVVLAAAEREGTWEFAFSTAPAWQRRGIATRLGRWMLDHLAAAGAREVHIFTIPKSLAMRAVAAKLGFHVRVEDGEVLATRRLAPAAPAVPS
jgi:RimJ/RimL family protein N-acetyltransferase